MQNPQLTDDERQGFDRHVKKRYVQFNRQSNQKISSMKNVFIECKPCCHAKCIWHEEVSFTS